MQPIRSVFIVILHYPESVFPVIYMPGERILQKLSTIVFHCFLLCIIDICEIKV